LNVRALPWLPCAAVALLAILPAASAHIQLTVTAPATPLPVGKTTDVAVDGGAECSDIFVGPPPVASVDRTFELANGTPAGMKWTGDTVTFSASGCVNAGDPGTSHNSGKVHLTPDGTLPAFSNLPFQVVCDECEGGEFTAQVGYFGAVNATSAPTIPAGQALILGLEVTANYDTDLMLAQTAGAHASLTDLPATLPVDSPLLANRTTSLVPLALQAAGSGTGWTTDTIRLTIQPMARGHADMGNATTVTITVTNPTPAGTGSTSTTGTSHARTTPTSNSYSFASHATGPVSTPAKKSPGASPLLALGLATVAIAWLRRR
jgi:hypothetical protein